MIADVELSQSAIEFLVTLVLGREGLVNKQGSFSYEKTGESRPCFTVLLHRIFELLCYKIDLLFQTSYRLAHENTIQAAHQYCDPIGTRVK